MITRRQLFRRLITVAVGVTGITACQDDLEVDNVSKKSGLTGIDRTTLDAVVDTIVPRDQDPGAVEAGVSEVLLDLFDKQEEMKKHGEAILAHVEDIAQHKFRKPFHRLSLARREEIIRKILNSRRDDEQSARRAIVALHGRVIEAFYLSPVGQAMFGYYPPYPNGYPDYNAPPAI